MRESSTLCPNSGHRGRSTSGSIASSSERHCRSERNSVATSSSRSKSWLPPSQAESLVKIDVMRALDRLTPRQRAVVALHYYADMSSREIAKVLAIPDSTVRFHVMNARKILEPLLTVRDPQSASEKG